MLKVVALLQSALELDDFLLGPALPHCATDVGQQLLVVPRLLDEVGRARLHSIDSVFDRAVSGDHDDSQFGIALADIAQYVDAVAVRHCKVEQDEVIRTIGQPRQPFFAVAGDVDLVAFQFQQCLQRFADG